MSEILKSSARMQTTNLKYANNAEDANKKKTADSIDIDVESTAETCTSGDTLPESSGDVGHRKEP